MPAPASAPAGAPAAPRRVPSSRALLRELGGMLELAALALVRGIRPPYPWAAEFLAQLRFTIAVCFLPLVLTAFALSFGPAGIQASNFFGLFGALDRLGGAYELIVIRLFAPMVVGIILAGAAGTAICADLGARVVREEIDALRVMGAEPIRHLVVPRLLALLITGVLFDIFSVLAGLLGLVVVVLQNGSELGPVFHTFFSNATPLELEASLVKCGVFATIIAIVCCYKGITVSGGAEGVGRAVNQSVVICFLAIGFTDYVFTQLLLATHPILSQVRG